MKNNKQYYLCSNYACIRKEECSRFISGDYPLFKIKDNNSLFLNPIKSGKTPTSFFPNKLGMCESFIQNKKSQEYKNRHI